MNTCTVGWSSGPFGSASTSRGVARLTRSQSSTVGGRSPAACAMAGTCSRRLVEPPNAACSSIAFSIARGVRMAESAVPRAASRTSAWADCRAVSSQTGSPDGLSALCGSAIPSASATTCAVAAVPRNWHPPPGDPHARQPSSAASSALMRPCANRAPMVWTLPASSAPVAGSVTPPGTMMPGRWPHPASASIMAGRPLSQVAMPITPARPGSDRIRRRKMTAASLRYGRLSNIPAVPCVRPSHGSLQYAANGTTPSRAQRLRRLADEQADLPVAGVIPERDGTAVGFAQPALGAEDEILRPAGLGRVPAHPRVLGQAEEMAARLREQHLRRDGQTPGGPLRREARRREQATAAAEQGVQIILRHPVATIPRQSAATSGPSDCGRRVRQAAGAAARCRSSAVPRTAAATRESPPP